MRRILALVAAAADLGMPALAITDLANAYLPTASGKSIPLTQIARVGFTWEPGVMWRENRNYAITVQSDTAEGLQGATVTEALLPSLHALQAKWPAGYSIQVAGAVAESSKGSSSIAAGMPLMLFIMFTLLMLQLQSFSRALLVFLTGPLGIAGVAAALRRVGGEKVVSEKLIAYELGYRAHIRPELGLSLATFFNIGAGFIAACDGFPGHIAN
mgnify:CR=1 FL=1